MQMKNRITSFLVITALILLVVLAFHVRVGVTADSIAVLKTNGMTCGSCSNKISKALESVNGVAVTEVDIAGGWVIVGYDTRTVKPESLAEKVKGAGFDSNVHVVLTPEQFKQITGRVVGQNQTASKGCGGGCVGSK